MNEKKIDELKNRIQTISLWPERFAALKARGIYKNQFCKKYDLCVVTLSRTLNGKSLPNLHTVQDFENALQSEGV